MQYQAMRSNRMAEIMQLWKEEKKNMHNRREWLRLTQQATERCVSVFRICCFVLSFLTCALRFIVNWTTLRRTQSSSNRYSTTDNRERVQQPLCHSEWESKCIAFNADKVTPRLRQQHQIDKHPSMYNGSQNELLFHFHSISSTFCCISFVSSSVVLSLEIRHSEQRENDGCLSVVSSVAGNIGSMFSAWTIPFCLVSEWLLHLLCLDLATEYQKLMHYA